MREMIVFVVCCNVRLRRRPLQHAKLSGACLTKITVRGSCLNSEILKKLICLKIDRSQFSDLCPLYIRDPSMPT